MSYVLIIMIECWNCAGLMREGHIKWTIRKRKEAVQVVILKINVRNSLTLTCRCLPRHELRIYRLWSTKST